LLPPYALILAKNAPKCVWRPGSAGPAGELKRSPRLPSPNKGGLLLRGWEGRGGGEGWKGRGKGEAKGGRGRGKGEAEGT